MANWKKIAQTDKRLREAADNASAALAEHRYNNTIAVGVSFREYARQCGVGFSLVARYANAWKLCTSSAHLSISEALLRASTSAERADVIEEIAEASGVTPAAIKSHHRDEVRRIESIARERSSARGTSIRDEARTLATTAARQRNAERNRKAARREKTDLRYLELERYLQAARRSLVNAAAVDAELDDEHRELIAEAIRVVRELISLIDMRFVGASNVDWDAELARITGEGE